MPIASLALEVDEGAFVGPIPLASASVILKVTERSPAPADGSDIMSHIDSLTASEFFTPWFNDAVRAAEIDVDPTIGQWSRAGVGILPPE